jgi:hypothetical protein
MWDFSLSKAIGAVIRTAPFVVLRMIVYFGIGIAYVMTVGIGGAVGYGFGHFSANPDAPLSGAFWGGAIGFGITSAAFYFAREYILYLVKAAHIACLVEVLDGKPIPGGQNQVSYGAKFVETHFAEASVLFGVDQIIKGVLRSLFRIINFVSAFLPIPGLQGIVRLVESVIRMSLTYVDEVLLGYLIRTRTTNPWDTAKDGLILYAQNYGHFVKNAIWLSIFMWVLTFVIFIVFLAPVAGLVALFPGNATFWGFAIAFIFAWAFKAAFLEPVAIAALMQVYFKTIEGQTPNAEWEQRLSTASNKFRQLAQKASGWVPRPDISPVEGAASAGKTA